MLVLVPVFILLKIDGCVDGVVVLVCMVFVFVTAQRDLQRSVRHKLTGGLAKKDEL